MNTPAKPRKRFISITVEIPANTPPSFEARHLKAIGERACAEAVRALQATLDDERASREEGSSK